MDGTATKRDAPHLTSNWLRMLPRKHNGPNRIHEVVMPPLLVRERSIARNSIATVRLPGLELDLKLNASGTQVSVDKIPFSCE
ncbi:hypothetical protein NHJ13051_005271 [Beauveria bassiana]